MEQDKNHIKSDTPLALLILEGIRKAVANAIAEHKKAGRDPREVQHPPSDGK